MPSGKWNVEYTAGAVGQPPETDIIVIDASGGVTFERESPADTCIPGGGPGKVTKNEGTVDASCALSATWAASYCFSGETQSLMRELSLQFVSSASADGSMTLTRGNVGPKTVTTHTAKATPAP